MLFIKRTCDAARLGGRVAHLAQQVGAFALAGAQVLKLQEHLASVHRATLARPVHTASTVRFGRLWQGVGAGEGEVHHPGVGAQHIVLDRFGEVVAAFAILLSARGRKGKKGEVGSGVEWSGRW